MSRDQDKLHCAKLASAILRGEIEIVEGCRRLVAALHGAGLDRDPDAICLIGIDSETDGLPVGAVRELWTADALAEKDAERAVYVERVQSRVMDACRALVTKLGGGAEASGE